MTKQKKGFLLVGLLVLWGILMFTQFSGESPPPGISFSPVELSLQQVQTSEESMDLAQILEPGRQNVSFSHSRNIFAPLTFKKPPPPPKSKSKPVVAKPLKPSDQKTAATSRPITWRVSRPKGTPATQHLSVPGIPQKRRKKPSLPD